MRHGKNLVTSYYTKMKDLWDELDVLAPISSCDCEESRPSVEHLKSQRVLQFLMGLNESYGNVRSNILARRPVDSVNEAYAIVTQEESQRTLGVVDTHRDPLTMLVGKTQGFKPKGTWLICAHCGYKDHLKENFYKIVGYPPDFIRRKLNNLVETHASWVVEHSLVEDSDHMPIMQQLKISWIGRESNGLHILQREFKPTVGTVVTRRGNEADLWYLRMRHPSAVAMRHIPSLKNKVNNVVHEKCSVCPLAKQIRLPTAILDGKTPYELLYGKELRLDHIRVFGCLCYASSLPRGDKLAPRVRRTMLMGYSETQKGYRLFDLDTKTFFVSRDVSFREGIFPFRSMQIENEEEVLFMPVIDMTNINKHVQAHTLSSDHSQAHTPPPPPPPPPPPDHPPIMNMTIIIPQQFTTVDYDTHVGGITDLVLPDATPYQKLIGKLLYLAITRPDINFVVHVLSQFMQQPKASHWEATLRLVRYLMGSSGQGILLKNNPCTQLTVFCDSDWAACLNTRKSVTGYIVKLGDSIISWKLKKQHTMSRSSAEAEYRSMTAAISKVIWIIGLLKELNVSVTTPVKLF
ncbi:uncharacterized protein LOC107797435 [Nicotiana tabacum]|uniref:Uncharacterized protein LOC107797435 n=1 Tax=Nicotiana tabacum TaxID=4097 RepID=A0AC58S750_TOBAC